MEVCPEPHSAETVCMYVRYVGVHQQMESPKAIDLGEPDMQTPPTYIRT